jgi:hypothetical protein
MINPNIKMCMKVEYGMILYLKVIKSAFLPHVDQNVFKMFLKDFIMFNFSVNCL